MAILVLSLNSPRLHKSCQDFCEMVGAEAKFINGYSNS
jgi:hypothetical protein